MTVLGPAILDHCQQRDMERHRKTLVIGRDRVFADAAARAKVGDLWWVKESFCEVQSHQFQGPRHVHEMVPGSAMGMTIPERLRPYWHLLRKRGGRPAVDLRRGDSRATLKIYDISDLGFHCTVEMVNVDVLLCRAA